MSRKYSILMTAICDGCGRHYLPREQVMEILGVGRTRFYKLPVLRRLNGTVRCDDLKRYVAEEEARPESVPREKRTAAVLPGYVYLFKWRDFYKIGLSERPSVRLRSINAGRWPETEIASLIHTIMVLDMYRAERALHAKFQAARMSDPWREWFRLSEQDVAWICALRDGGLDEPEATRD